MSVLVIAGSYEARAKDNILILICEDKKERAIAYFGNELRRVVSNGEVLLQSENVLILKERKCK